MLEASRISGARRLSALLYQLLVTTPRWRSAGQRQLRARNPTSVAMPMLSP